MDKYQKYLVGGGDISIRVVANKGSTPIKDQELSLDGDLLRFSQNEDITITSYAIVMFLSRNARKIISKREVLVGEKWISIGKPDIGDLPPKHQKIYLSDYVDTYTYKFNIDNQSELPSKLRLTFLNDICIPITIDIVIQFADRDTYYEKMNEEKRQNLIRMMNPEHKTGDSVINFYWNFADETLVAETVLELFSASKGGRRIILKKKFDNATLFSSISGLAYGEYEYKISQFDGNHNLIVSTDFIKVSLRSSHYAGKNLVCG